jgi:hypothetical protein
MSVSSLSIPEWSVRDMADRELHLAQRPDFSVNVSFNGVNWVMIGCREKDAQSTTRRKPVLNGYVRGIIKAHSIDTDLSSDTAR